MTYITEFSIEGLAGRKGVYSQKLNRDVNIFFGLNGSGKTSLLKIIHSALDNNVSLISNTAFLSAQVKFYSVIQDKIVTRTYDREKPKSTTEEDKAENALLKAAMQQQLELRRLLNLKSEGNKWNTKTKLSPPSNRFAVRYLPTSRLLFANPTDVTEGKVSSEEQLDSISQRLLVSLWSGYTAKVNEQVRKAQEEGLTNILKWILSSEGSRPKKSIDTLNVDIAFDRVKSFLERQNAHKILGSREEFKSHYMNSQVLKNVVNYIDEVEVKIADAMSPRTKLQDLISNLFSGNKRVVFSDKSIDVITEDSTSIGLASLSSGEKQLIRILVETLEVGENCLLIDEPEISMHIDWQRELITTMRDINPQAQLIIATHSPEIMANIDDDKIFPL